MEITRADFLKIVSVSAGLGLSGLPAFAVGAEGEAGGGTGGGQPEGPSGGLDSQRFRRAVAAGDLAEIERYLTADPALAWGRDEKGRSMLVLAHLAGQPKVVELLRPRLAGLDVVESLVVGDRERVGELLEKFPRLVNEPHPVGGTPVHVAVRLGRTDLVFALLRPGPDFNAPSTEPPGLTPLRLAVEHPDPGVAAELLDAMAGNGGNPNTPQGDGLSPLHVAARAGSAEMVRVLVFSGADIEARTPDGATALDLAVRQGHAEVAALLRDPGRLPKKHRTSRFAYTVGGERYEPREQPPIPWPIVNEYVGASHGNLARVRELLAVYPNLLHVNASWDELAVEAGAHVGWQEGVRFQLDQGAPCSLPTAAMVGNLALVRRLLAEDPLRIHDPGAHHMPAAWFPAVGGGTADHLEAAKLLLDAGADVNAHKRGQTALHWAARGGQIEMAELLLARGADVNARAKIPGGEATPLAMALKAEKKEMAGLLRRHGGV